MITFQMYMYVHNKFGFQIFLIYFRFANVTVIHILQSQLLLRTKLYLYK